LNKLFSTILVMLLGVTGVNATELDTFQKEAINSVIQLNRNCSAVVINTSEATRTYAITANHCVSGRASPDSKEKSGYVTLDVKDKQKLIETNEYVYDVILRDVQQDLAVIKLRKEGLLLTGANIATEDPTEGEQVWTVGYPLGMIRTVTAGFFGGFQSMSSDLRLDQFGSERALYRATPPIFGGNSGGGLFKKNGEGYELVGIADVVIPSFFVTGWYVPQTAINDIVKRALKSETETKSVTVEQKKKLD